MNLVQQFQNLLDPSTALGAFLISLLAGVVCSFCLVENIKKKLTRKILLKQKKLIQLFKMFVKLVNQI